MKLLVCSGLVAAGLAGILAARVEDYRSAAEAAAVMVVLYALLFFRFEHGRDVPFVGIAEAAPQSRTSGFEVTTIRNTS